MSQPLVKTDESEKAESQRKTYKGIGCAAGVLGFSSPIHFWLSSRLGNDSTSDHHRFGLYVSGQRG